MKTPREKFEENYMAVTVPAENPDGFKIQYVYYRPWHIWDLPMAVLKRKKRRILIFSIVDLLLFLATGALSAEINTRIWVAVPAILSLCALIFEVVGAFQFYAAPYESTEITYRDVNTKLKTAPVIRACFLVVALAASVYVLLLIAYSPLSLLACFGYLAQILLALGIFTGYREIPLRTRHNTALEDYGEGP